MADSPTILSWNPANWLTVLLMVGLGYFILGAVVKTLRERKGSTGGQ